MALMVSPVNSILRVTHSGVTMMDDMESPIEALRLVGGRFCLDFANTIDARGGSRRRECLHSFADLLRWSRHAGLAQEEFVQRLLEQARERPTDATTRYEQALALREA